MSDTNLADDQCKLVDWSLVFIKRDHEFLVDKGQKLISYPASVENLWAIVMDRASVKKKLAKKQVSEDDRQRYLRLYYGVLARWRREEAEYQKRTADAVEEISRKIG